MSGVGAEMGFAFTRCRRGCFCVPAPGEGCCHSLWTGKLDRGFVKPAKPARGGGAAAAQPRTRRTGPSAAFRQSIDMRSLLCMPGDEDDETADGESVWYANALGVRSLALYCTPSAQHICPLPTSHVYH